MFRSGPRTPATRMNVHAGRASFTPRVTATAPATPATDTRQHPVTLGPHHRSRQAALAEGRRQRMAKIRKIHGMILAACGWQQLSTSR